MSNRSQSFYSERGMVLVTSLLLLVVVTILAIGLFHGFGLDEKVAGNTREKQRALQASVSAEQYAEWWLVNGTSVPFTNCAGTVQSSVGQICTNVLSTQVANVAVVPWSFGGQTVQVTYPAPGITTGTGGNYYQYPAYYISYLGVGTGANGIQGNVYQIDAVGYGSSPSTAAVVESTFIVQTSTTSDKSGL
jgi:type IV pilus assembly protein PilX